jgi:hypothetical protein
MRDAVPVGVLLLIALTFMARVLLLLAEWPASSSRLWPWLRLQPWWPVASDHTAETLLKASLSETEYHCLRSHAYVEVASPSHDNRVYRIPRGPGQVLVVENGRVTERLCVQPMESLPEADVILLHKLLIQGDEPTYLATANHFPRARWH